MVTICCRGSHVLILLRRTQRKSNHATRLFFSCIRLDRCVEGLTYTQGKKNHIQMYTSIQNDADCCNVDQYAKPNAIIAAATHTYLFFKYVGAL